MFSDSNDLQGCFVWMLADVLNCMVWFLVPSYMWKFYLVMNQNLEEVTKNSGWMALKAARTWAEDTGFFHPS